jgi:hypothetical protein
MLVFVAAAAHVSDRDIPSLALQFKNQINSDEHRRISVEWHARMEEARKIEERQLNLILGVRKLRKILNPKRQKKLTLLSFRNSIRLSRNRPDSSITLMNSERPPRHSSMCTQRTTTGRIMMRGSRTLRQQTSSCRLHRQITQRCRKPPRLPCMVTQRKHYLKSRRPR